MYLHAMIGLISIGRRGRDADRHAAGRRYPFLPKDLAGLGDSQLRDLGFERERKVSFRNLMWM